MKNIMWMYGLDYDELLFLECWECICCIYCFLGYKLVNLSVCCEWEGIEFKYYEVFFDVWGCVKLYFNFFEKYCLFSILWWNVFDDVLVF